MTIGTAVDQGQTRAVVVRRMTLQAERRLTYRKHVLVRRAMGGVTLHAALIDRRVLEREWPLIFRMATETQLVRIGHLEAVSRVAAVRIMTIHATHLAFANRVMVGKVGFGILLGVSPQAVFTELPRRRDRPVFAVSFSMNAVAVAALDVLCLVCARKPIPHMIRFRVATKAHPVRLLRRPVAEADDLVFRFARVPARRHMQTACPMALFAPNVLHRVRAPPVALEQVRVTLRALVRPYLLRTGDVYELAEVLSDLVGCGCLGFALSGRRWSEQKEDREERSEKQSTSPHNDLPDHRPD